MQAGLFVVAVLPAEQPASFFDVWAEITIGGQVMHTAAPLPLRTVSTIASAPGPARDITP